MGTPKYPDDWAARFAALENGVKDALTAARSRVKFARLLAQMLTVGEGNDRIEIDPTSRTITFYLTGPEVPAARLLASEGTGYTVLVMASTHQAGAVAATPATANVESGGWYASLHSQSSPGARAEYQAKIEPSGQACTAQTTALGGGTPTQNRITLWTSGELEILADVGTWIQGRSGAPAAGSGGGYLYATAAGALRWRGPTTDTQIAPA
ncbi:hypothetical protein [Actinomadura rubrisoli]|uniref:Uncharacterized protein n=1 Tax=Actinomadura rubrisoli TaxID=2530368 RepID=A0A4V2YXU1_9ACTN|nr:hypothetical protein [Actinomadura rubrisoli]TDD90767.1 hypothetical protein E1298_12765 [Actinomadura rubrisoli]